MKITFGLWAIWLALQLKNTDPSPHLYEATVL